MDFSECLPFAIPNNTLRIQRDHILANHDRRKEQLKKLLVEAREKVDDHESGRILLEDDEYAKFTKRVTLYANKVSSYRTTSWIPPENWYGDGKGGMLRNLTMSTFLCIFNRIERKSLKRWRHQWMTEKLIV